jgi:hypothetical protein
MGDQHADPFVNRDTPIPVLSVTGPSSSSTPRTPHDGSKHHLSASKLKDKLDSLGDLARTESPSNMSDRLFTMYTP